MQPNARSIARDVDVGAVRRLLRTFPVTALTGARQCGKTTLARLFKADHCFDLENPADSASMEQPLATLERLRGLVVIDEIQRQPELFGLLRHLVDQKAARRFLILGSASGALLRQSSESLAGRIGYYELGGLRLGDVGRAACARLWLRGGYPRAFTARSHAEAMLWLEHYITTYLERDIPQLGLGIPAAALRRFWIMLSHYHGQELNYAELARSFGMSDHTVRRYVDILCGTFMVRTLQPWHVNVGKRLVKHPKLYLRDSGVFHALQAIDTSVALRQHVKLGASWEGFALEQAIRAISLPAERFFFWRTHAGAEVDLFWQAHGKSWAVECKFADAPRMSKGLYAALADLGLAHLWIVYPGSRRYALTARVTVMPLADVGALWKY